MGLLDGAKEMKGGGIVLAAGMDGEGRRGLRGGFKEVNGSGLCWCSDPLFCRGLPTREVKPIIMAA